MSLFSMKPIHPDDDAGKCEACGCDLNGVGSRTWALHKGGWSDCLTTCEESACMDAGELWETFANTPPSDWDESEAQADGFERILEHRDRLYAHKNYNADAVAWMEEWEIISANSPEYDAGPDPCGGE